MTTPVLIVTGSPGTGKTTAAGTLAGRATRGVHLKADLFFDFVCSGFVEPWKPESQEQNEAVMGIVAAAAAGYADAGYFTVVDGIVIPGKFLEPLAGALRDAGHPVAYAVLRAPLSVCIARVQGREGEQLTDPAVIEQLWHNFEDLGPLERNAVDVGERSAEDVAGELAQRLADGLLEL